MREAMVRLYHLSELTDRRAKERARDYIREQVTNDDYDATECDCKTVYALLGFTAEAELLWSGFSTQGSGACIAGTWYACNVYPDMLKAHAPKDEALHRIADQLQKFAAAHPALVVKTKHSGRYCHECSVDFEYEGDDADDQGAEAFDYDEFKDTLRSLMRWCYRAMEDQHDFLHSVEHIDQEADEREYEFTIDGRHWRDPSCHTR